MTRKLLSLTLGLPVALAFGAGAAVGHRAPVDLVGAVAVVDTDVVQQAFPLAIEREKELKALQAKFNTELDDLARDRKARAMEIESAEEGSQARDNLMVEAEMAHQRYQIMGSTFERALTRRRAELMTEVQLKLREGIARFAQQKGFQLVLRCRSAANRMESNLVDDVIFSARPLDVTDQVVQFLRAADPNPNPNPDGSSK